MVGLLIQFSDGLFARYWAGFDEILRHGGRTIELTARIPIPVLGAFDMTRPVTLRGVRCLPDTLGYSVPAGRKAETELKLRALTTQGAYDIAAEQGIPAFAAAARKLVWKLLSETFGDDLADDRTLRMAAANEYIEQTGYTPHGTDGDWYKVDLQGAIPVSVTRKVPEWQDDPALMPPTSQGARVTRGYVAKVTYDIYEIHDLAVQGSPEDCELSDEPIGRGTVETAYTVSLVAVWGTD